MRIVPFQSTLPNTEHRFGSSLTRFGKPSSSDSSACIPVHHPDPMPQKPPVPKPDFNKPFVEQVIDDLTENPPRMIINNAAYQAPMLHWHWRDMIDEATDSGTRTDFQERMKGVHQVFNRAQQANCMIVLAKLFFAHESQHCIEIDHIKAGLYSLKDGERIRVGRELPNPSREGFHRLKHKTVSKAHAEFYAKNGQIWVKDLNSTNGTQVNGKRIQAPTPLLAPNDDDWEVTVTLGKVPITLRSDLLTDEFWLENRRGEGSS